MEHKAVNFIIQGMQRDLNIARYDQNFAYENMNIRLTAMQDKTLLAITNEKGNKKIIIKDESGNSNLSIVGSYVGHCIVGKYLVLFTTGDLDYIYRFKFIDGELYGTLLHSNKLGFSVDNPIEALGVYESENIQKVYWVDGKNPTRYMNIMNLNKYDGINNATIFDFTGDVPYPKEFKVTKNNNSSGEFASGIIQYTYSFYDKNGRESNLIDVSPLLYVSHSDRGGNAETICNNSFTINIEGINNLHYKYDYIRIYSIHRTSLNAIPVTRIVTDIKLDLDSASQNISYTDVGTVGSNIDPYELLYKGGESIIPKTLVAKDNTLFLGNYESKSNKVDDSIKEAFNNIDIIFGSKEANILNDEGGYYSYKFQLNNNSNEITTFKQGETYKFGIQLQDKRGKWSEVIPIKSDTIPYSISSNGSIVNLPSPYINIKSIVDTFDTNSGNIIKDNYSKVRGVVVYPNNTNRTIIAQGMLCPTVFNLNNRMNGGLFAQSSWFARPFTTNGFDTSLKETTYNTRGTALEFRHEYIVPVDNSMPNMEIGVSPTKEINTAPINPWGESVEAYKFDNSLYYVDQSILSFHSPEFTFSEENNNIEDLDLRLRIVGFIPLTSFVSDISISTQSVGLYNDEIKDQIKVGVKGPSSYGYRSLVSGLFYNDASYSKTEVDKEERYSYLVFPWHRNGSLNDTPKLGANKTRTAVLKKKVMSNLKFSKDNIFMSSHWEAYAAGDNNKTGITKVKIFNSNEPTVVKIPKPLNSNIEDITYTGNIDTIATGYNQIYRGKSVGDFDSEIVVHTNDDISKLSRDPVSIKYKSTPHAVFGLNYTSKKYLRTLPALNGLNKTDRTTNVYWDTNLEDFKMVVQPEQDSSKKYTELYTIGEYPSYDEIYDLEDPDKVLIFINSENKFYRCKGIDTDAKTVEWVERTFKPGTYFYWDSGDETIYYKWGVDYTKHTSIYTDSINLDTEYGGFYLAELYKENVINSSTSNIDKESDLWYPAGESVDLSGDSIIVKYEEGDTFYQRFDCLKTYPYTNEDQNSIVEIVSFMCETHINIDGRYDRNRGQINNLNMSPTNFNLFNTVYNQKNNFFNYRILKEGFDITKFPTTITWSLNKSLGEDIDSWTKFNLASSLELDGNNGELQKLQILNDSIYSFQDSAIAKILFNSRVQIPTSEGVPIEIANSGKVDGKVYLTQEIGTINKWSVVTTPGGTYFIDNNNLGIYLLGDGIKCISDMLNMISIIKEHNSNREWKPNSADNFRCFYDKINSDVYFVNKDICLCYNELLGQFTSFYNYENTPMMVNIEGNFISYKDNSLWKFFDGDYNSFYGNIKPFYTTFIANPEPTRDKIFNNLDFRADTYSGDTLLDNRTFDTLEVWNEYQRGKNKLVNVIGRTSNLKKKFRVWRAQIPRHNNGLQRIRNPWCYIKLSMDNPSNYKTILYDTTLSYSV